MGLEETLLNRLSVDKLTRLFIQYIGTNGNRRHILDVVSDVNLWMEDTLTIIRYMYDKGIAKPDGQYVTIDTDVLLKDMMNDAQLKKFTKPNLDKVYDCSLSQDEKEIVRKFKLATADRPINDRFEQYYSTPETNIMRMRIASQYPRVGSKALCFLGDDDMTSLTFAMSGKFEDIDVYDIDERLIDFINSKRDGLKIKNYRAHLYDYREQFKGEKGYDVFFCDPPATKEAIELVLKRTGDMANENATLYLSWPDFLFDEKYLSKVQSLYIPNGWVIKAKFPDINKYDNICFLNNMHPQFRETMNIFGISDSDIVSAKPLLHYGLTELSLIEKPHEKTGKYEKEIYLINLKKIPGE